ncbi:unnamed protein product [Bursaphelenchus xylophilus]|uniref:(pine wood nematode) hypothetical protein n=1 Tax=Bursaphelenchus xylophilus TaxID=6326 RepID=A0A1I7RVR4_BURXY|nr:unnamed protein product [Bursaphelenchus xylophilus]CAG9082041.1 unnamed protein product [Bursaphelenchus xylophilus]
MDLNALNDSKLSDFSRNKENWVIDEDSTQCFHYYHAQNIDITQNPRVARRQWSYHGMCFSANPIEPLRPFLIHIDEVEFCWTGHLRLGVTTVDPATRPILDSQPFTSKTALVAFPQLSSTVHAGDVVGVYYEIVENNCIQLHVLVNDKDFCSDQLLPLQASNDKVFAVVDIFGMTKRITFIPMKKTVRSLSSICEKAIVASLGKDKSLENLPLPMTIKSSIASLRSKRRMIPV